MSSPSTAAEDETAKEQLRLAQEEEDAFKAGTPPEASASGSETGGEQAEGNPSPLSVNRSNPENSGEGSGEDNSESEDDGLTATKLRQEELRQNNLQQNTWLRKVLAYAAVGMVSLQLLTSNLFFAYFLAHNVNDPDPRIMIAWLTSSVVEVIGILLVVARSLFKGRKKSASPTP